MGERYPNFRRAPREREPFHRGLPFPAAPDLLFLAGISLAIFAGLGIGFVLG
jgi:hypothetical protein